MFSGMKRLTPPNISGSAETNRVLVHDQALEATTCASVSARVGLGVEPP